MLVTCRRPVAYLTVIDTDRPTLSPTTGSRHGNNGSQTLDRQVFLGVKCGDEQAEIVL